MTTLLSFRAVFVIARNEAISSVTVIARNEAISLGHNNKPRDCHISPRSQDGVFMPYRKNLIFETKINYNTHMKKVFEETGKYLYDISKISLGIAIITPLIDEKTISFVAVVFTVTTFAIGAFLFKKGEQL